MDVRSKVLPWLIVRSDTDPQTSDLNNSLVIPGLLLAKAAGIADHKKLNSVVETGEKVPASLAMQGHPESEQPTGRYTPKQMCLTVPGGSCKLVAAVK